MSVTFSGVGTGADGVGCQRFGDGFVDAGSGLCFEAHHPAESRELWVAYLDGASERYRYHGVEAALDRSKIEDGGSTSLFWLTRDAGVAIAGLRCQGPLASSADACALEELASLPELDKVRASIDARVPFGVLEVKGVLGRLRTPRQASAQRRTRPLHRPLDELVRRAVRAMHRGNARSASLGIVWRTRGRRPLTSSVP